MVQAARRTDAPGYRLEFTALERDAFRARPFVPPSQWAEDHVVVMDGPYAGSRWRNDLTPYLVGIMDTWASPDVDEVVVCAVAQSGKTRAMYNCMAWGIDRRPGPRMLAMPDDDALDRAVEHKLLPGMRASRITRAKLGKMTKEAVAFRDGSVLYLSSAQSPSSRASVSVRDLFLDEEDLYRRFAGQADPVGDFRERVRSFARKSKIFRTSKPVGGEESSVWTAITRECQEVRGFEVVCPACRHPQLMRFAQIKFLQGCRDPRRMKAEKLARYECERCRYHWTDVIRDRAVGLGGWRPVRHDEDKGFVPCAPSHRPRIVGFHLPAMISPFVSLSEIAAAFLTAREDPSRWPEFYNGFLAEPYVPAASKTSAETILEAREKSLPPRTVPDAAVALTCGIDIQKRGLWYVVRAWADTLESWLVDYGFLGTLEEARVLLFDTVFPVEGGGQRGIWRAGVDTGGGSTDDGVWTRTEEIYQWIRANGAGKAFACKGSSHAQIQPVRRTAIDRLPKSGRLIPGGLVLHIIDTDYFKRLIHARFRPEHTQPMHLHGQAGEDYAEQVSAEELVIVKGKAVWKQVRRDNHLLDCEVLAAACAAAEWMPSLQLLARGMSARQPAERPARRERPETTRRW